MEKLEEQLKSEERVKEGIEKLSALYKSKPKNDQDNSINKNDIKAELDSSVTKIDAIKRQIESVKGLLNRVEGFSRKPSPSLLDRKSSVRRNQNPTSSNSSFMKKSNTVANFTNITATHQQKKDGIVRNMNNSFACDNGIIKPFKV